MPKLVNYHQPTEQALKELYKRKGMGDVLVPIFAAFCAMLWMRPFKILAKVILRCYFVMFLLWSRFKAYSKRFFVGVA